MSALALPLLSDPALVAWQRAAVAVGETHSLGATFTLDGAAIAVKGAGLLPQRLRSELEALAEDGLLRRYLLSGDDPDRRAQVFLREVLKVEAVLVEDHAGVCPAVAELRRDLVAHDGDLGLDIETCPQPGQGEPRPPILLNQDGTPAERQPKWKNDAGLDPHRARIACLQLYAGGDKVFVFRGAALARMVRLRWLRRQHLVIHNAQFEIAFLTHHAGRTPRHPVKRGHFDCTSQAMGLVHGVGFGGEGRSLEKAASVVLGLAIPKELQLSAWSAEELTEGQVAYAGADAVLAYRLWPKLKAELQHRPARQTWSLWEAYELQRRAIPGVAAMEHLGLGFDRAEHTCQIEDWSLKLATARHQYKDITGSAPPTSQKDKQAWLRQVLEDHPDHLEVWPRTATGLLSTRAGQLKRLVFIDTVRAMLEIQTYEKLLSSFGPKLAQKISPVTGRIHGHYNLAATKGGRFSASNPNLQQLPRRRAGNFPRCVVAAPGYLLVSCDWSMVEMRGAAWLYQDRALTRIFAEGRDIHSETAASINGCPIGEISSTQRDGAKAINYGSIFGQGPQGLRESAFLNYGIELSLVEAERACARFRKAYPDLHQGLWDNYHLCKRRGYILIGAGRIVKAEWETDVGRRLLYTRCCNLPIQGIVSDALLRAITWLHGRLKQARIRGGLVAAIHDEILLEVHEDDAEKARLLLEETMTEAFAETFPGGPTLGLAKAKIGRTWWDTKQ